METKLAYPAVEAFKIVGLGRTRGFEAIKSGALKSYALGRKRMVSHSALEAFVAARESEAQGTKKAA
jgi:hypothetical protein